MTKPSEAAEDQPDTARLMRLATYASVATAATLIVVKLAAWGLTGSVALLSTLIDSTMDAAASVINLWAVRHALTPADQEHRFGHGKAEPLAGLGQSAFIVGSGALLLAEAVDRLRHPIQIGHADLGMAVMAFSILLTVLLVRFQKRVLSRIKSVAITADSLHYTGDVLINGSVIVSLLIGVTLGWTFIDPLFAMAISAFLLWNAWKIARNSFDMLMDRELPEEDRQRITEITRAHPQVRGMHDLRTRLSGQQGFIQLHLALDDYLPLAQAHDIADQVEAAILAAFPHFDIIIHQDPASLHEEQPADDPRLP